LEVIGRVGEHKVHASVGELVQFRDAIAHDDLVAGRRKLRDGTSGRAASSTSYLKLGGEAGRPGTGTTHARDHSNATIDNTPSTRFYVAV
jgi:hypothetical protein